MAGIKPFFPFVAAADHSINTIHHRSTILSTATMSFDASTFESLALGLETGHVEQSARAIIAEAEAVRSSNAKIMQEVLSSQKIETRLGKEKASRQTEMAQRRRDASIASEDATIRASTRATLLREMQQIVHVVSPPTSPTGSSTTTGDNNNDGTDPTTAGRTIDSRDDTEDNERNGGDGTNNDNGSNESDAGLLHLNTTTTINGQNHIHPEKYLSQRRQEYAKTKITLLGGNKQIQANKSRRHQAEMENASVRDRIANDNLTGQKAAHDSEVDEWRRKLEAAKRREKSIGDVTKSSRERFGEHGAATAAKNGEISSLKKESDAIESKQTKDLAEIEAEITKATITEVAVLEARMATLSGQLDHIRKQHDDIEKIRSDTITTNEDLTAIAATMKNEEAVKDEATNEQSNGMAEVEAVQAKLADVQIAENEADKLDTADDEDEAAKKESVETEKGELIQKRNTVSNLIVALQNPTSEDHSSLDLAEKARDRKKIESKTEANKLTMQGVEADIVTFNDEAAKDDTATEKQLDALKKMRSATGQNIQTMKETKEAKKADKLEGKKIEMETIRQGIKEKKSFLDLALSVTRGGRNLIDEMKAKTDAISNKIIPKFEPDTQQSDAVETVEMPDQTLSAETTFNPSPTRGSRSGRRRRGVGGVGSRRRRSA